MPKSFGDGRFMKIYSTPPPKTGCQRTRITYLADGSRLVTKLLGAAVEREFTVPAGKKLTDFDPNIRKFQEGEAGKPPIRDIGWNGKPDFVEGQKSDWGSVDGGPGDKNSMAVARTDGGGPLLRLLRRKNRQPEVPQTSLNNEQV